MKVYLHMKKLLILISLICLSNIVSAADEPSPAALAGANGCLICHNASQK